MAFVGSGLVGGRTGFVKARGSAVRCTTRAVIAPTPTTKEIVRNPAADPLAQPPPFSLEDVRKAIPQHLINNPIAWA
eukprot:CAMPEP_0198735928 /NCGR_PEP_ID=MMETSP1475-20131203/62534_1 /TAXON_ID= ORGANISM="Unidentified sp., Strain CCMP1999" /NCGR_SAMPLE_ID=MMETSP1475 /ASSEMBLY_ACC=CAM_ASM_001111 /LENGTH=76 /DNA_ID=CAMNT_0044499663 /DNA_START=54 /DNA_END=281 /DNA_ORIENTATION=-